MKIQSLSIGLLSFLSASAGLSASAWGQNGFDLDRFVGPAPYPPGILTEAFPLPPVVAIPDFAMGLGPGDEIDALSFGDDFALHGPHMIAFSPDLFTIGVGAGTTFEAGIDTLPGAPPAAAGDIFVQDVAAGGGNILAFPGFGYDAGTFTGDEANATWASPCLPGGPCEDLDALDYGDPMTAAGVYFSLKPGSPVLGLIGATPGDILYSDLSGALPIIAVLGGGAGPATAGSLGIGGLDLDALSLVGTVGPVALGGGVIAAGPVGPSAVGTIAPSTHVLEFSVGSGLGFDADVLVRGAPGLALPHTPAPVLGLLPHENLNALEAEVPPPCPPFASTVFHYNGTGINLDSLIASKAGVGSPWLVTLTPQATRGAGPWTVLVRSAPAAGPAVDLGFLFTGVAGGVSELLVGAGFIADFPMPPHGGGGTATTITSMIPLACGLVGLPWHAQAIVLGDLPAFPGVVDPWFSSASGGVVGTF